MLSTVCLESGSIRPVVWSLSRRPALATVAVFLALGLAGMAACQPPDGDGQGNGHQSVTPSAPGSGPSATTPHPGRPPLKIVRPPRPTASPIR
jgi:hypothetical protein